MKDKSKVLLDTNILVYATFEDSILYKQAREIRDKAVRGEIKACLSPQILAEFYSVVTNSKRVTNPLTPKEAREIIELYFSTLHISKILMKRTTIQRTVKLAEKYKIKEQGIFDTQLIATMLDNGIKRIYTNNEKDFKKFKEIEVINPFDRKDKRD